MFSFVPEIQPRMHLLRSWSGSNYALARGLKKKNNRMESNQSSIYNYPLPLSFAPFCSAHSSS